MATASLAALVYALSQAATAGWTSARTLGFGLAGLAWLAAFAALEGRAAAFLAASAIAAGGGLLALLVLPSARSFLPKLWLAPSPLPIH